MDQSELDNLKYSQIKYESRSYAGLDGFDFFVRHRDKPDTVLLTVFVEDLSVAKAIDDGLKQAFKQQENED